MKTPSALRRAALAEHLEAVCHDSCRDGALIDEAVIYSDVLWTLASCMGARNVLEIGMGPQQVSGSTFIHLMAGNPGSQLVSVDIDPKPMPANLAMAERLGVTWRIIHGESLANETIAAAAVHQPYDLLYVDGAHDAAHALGDTLSYLPLVKHAGLIVIDDTADPGVTEACDALREKGVRGIHLSHHPANHPKGNGRFIFHKL